MAKAVNNIKTNRLNVYLIKETFNSEDSITKIGSDSQIGRVALPDVGIFYFKKSVSNAPEWLRDFFNNHSAIDRKQFFSSGSRAVLIVKIKHGKSERFFAIPFGSGRHLLQDTCFEERFGLITSLNVLESKGIRAIDKRTLSTNPKISREQIARASDAIDFQIDYDTDLIQAITGKSLNPAFGSTITGKEGLSVSAKVDLSNIKEFLRKSIETYSKTDYRKNFRWIDQIREERNEETIEKLNALVLDKINNNDSAVWLAIPEIIEWPDVKGFKYSTKKRDELHEELELSDFLSNYDGEIKSIDDLRNSTITCWSVKNDDYNYNWSTYSCLNAEVDIGKKKFFLSSSKWYEINSDLVTSVNSEFDKIRQMDLGLPDYDHKDEAAYNIDAARQINALCLDAQNLSYGGGHSKIEFCDILTRDKKLIHVKKYGGSSVLSHLFSQGFVSGELLLTDHDFRHKVIDELLTGVYKNVVPRRKPEASDYSICYCIITKQKKKTLSIPFFSKVVLRNYKRVLEAYGYSMFIAKITNVKAIDSDDEDD